MENDRLIDFSKEIEEFEETENIEILERLDKIPKEQFKDKWISNGYFMKLHSNHSLRYTCYQFAFANIIDKFHPGISLYIKTQFMKNKYKELNSEYTCEYFINILHETLRGIDKKTVGYDALIPNLEEKEEILNQDIFLAMNCLEEKILKNGYIMALENFHGEHYILSKENKIEYIPYSDIYSETILWSLGRIQEWYAKNFEDYSRCSFDQILQQTILQEEDLRDKNSLDTRFFSKEEFDYKSLVKAVKTESKKYNNFMNTNF